MSIATPLHNLTETPLTTDIQAITDIQAYKALVHEFPKLRINVAKTGNATVSHSDATPHSMQSATSAQSSGSGTSPNSGSSKRTLVEVKHRRTSSVGGGTRTNTPVTANSLHDTPITARSMATPVKPIDPSDELAGMIERTRLFRSASWPRGLSSIVQLQELCLEVQVLRNRLRANDDVQKELYAVLNRLLRIDTQASKQLEDVVVKLLFLSKKQVSPVTIETCVGTIAQPEIVTKITVPTILYTAASEGSSSESEEAGWMSMWWRKKDKRVEPKRNSDIWKSVKSVFQKDKLFQSPPKEVCTGC
jgi:hypothetical protein